LNLKKNTMTDMIIRYLKDKKWFRKLIAKHFYTNDQIEGCFWYGFWLSKAQDTSVERLDDDRITLELKKYLKRLDSVNKDEDID